MVRPLPFNKLIGISNVKENVSIPLFEKKVLLEVSC